MQYAEAPPADWLIFVQEEGGQDAPYMDVR